MYINVYSGFKQVWTVTRHIKGGTMKTSYQDWVIKQRMDMGVYEIIEVKYNLITDIQE